MPPFRLHAVALALLLAACDAAAPATTDVEAARARWEAAGLKDYEVEQRLVFVCHVCDGGTAERFARVVVRGGAVAAVYDAEGAFIAIGEVDPNAPPESRARTVEDVFAFIETTAEPYGLALVETRFDARLGYPRYVFARSANGEVYEEIQLRRLRPL